jgi:DNA repair protein RecO (recombination protein O)
MKTITQGIILKEQNIGERDKLITALTEDKGIIRGFAKGAKNIKSQNCAGTQLFSYSRLCLIKGKSRDTYVISEAKTTEMFFGLRNNMENMCLAQYFCELILNTLVDGEKNKGVLSLMLNSLYLLATQKRPSLLVKACFEMRLLSICGYMPDLTMCKECGEYNKDIFYFIPTTGEIYCSDCHTKESLPKNITLNSGEIHALRHTIYAEDKKLFSFSLSEQGLVTLNDATEQYVESQTERKYKTLDFYKVMRN